MSKELLYVYCISCQPPDLSGLGREKVYSITEQELYAIVSRVDEEEFSEIGLRKNLRQLDWIKIKAGEHERIIEAIMRQVCVIPLKFGIVFNTEDNLRTMLREQAENFLRILKNLAGKEEWGVKIFCDTEGLKEIIGQEESAQPQHNQEEATCGRAYFLRKKKETLLIESLNKRVNEYAQQSFELLRKNTIAACLNNLLPKEVTERKDDMILNAVFLIEQGRVVEFTQEAKELQAKYKGRGLSFVCTGPWPPYNFCTEAKV